MTTYISKGFQGKYEKCRGVNYIHNEKTYEYAYERSMAMIVIQDFNLKTTTDLTPESETDVLLPNNVQLPVTKKESLHPSYGTIAWEEPNIGCSKSESNEHLEMFEGHVNVCKKMNVDCNYDYKDALITHFANARSPDPLSFGFLLRQPVTICGLKAHQTNNQDISIIFLDEFERAHKFAKDVKLIRPYLTNVKPVATGMHINSAFNTEDVVKKL